MRELWNYGLVKSDQRLLWGMHSKGGDFIEVRRECDCVQVLVVLFKYKRRGKQGMGNNQEKSKTQELKSQSVIPINSNEFGDYKGI